MRLSVRIVLQCSDKSTGIRLRKLGHKINDDVIYKNVTSLDQAIYPLMSKAAEYGKHQSYKLNTWFRVKYSETNQTVSICFWSSTDYLTICESTLRGLMNEAMQLTGLTTIEGALIKSSRDWIKDSDDCWRYDDENEIETIIGFRNYHSYYNMY